MDLDEWELLPHDTFLQIDDDDVSTSRKYSTTVVRSNYFACSAAESSTAKFVDKTENHQLAPVPIVVEPTVCKDQVIVKREDLNREIGAQLEGQKGMMKLNLGEKDEGGLNLLKLSLTGIGAICSFGMAAATVCIVVFSCNRQYKNRYHNNKKQQLPFRIFTNNKVAAEDQTSS